jgi:hypothetical protein
MQPQDKRLVGIVHKPKQDAIETKEVVPDARREVYPVPMFRYRLLELYLEV